MNKVKKYLALSLVLVLAFSVLPLADFSMVLSAEEKSSDKKKEAPKLSAAEEEKKSYAMELGAKYGEMYAVRDFARKLKSNNNRHFNSKAVFDKHFNREKSSDSFFYTEFRKAFKEAYDVKYNQLNNESYQNGDLEWFAMSEKFGRVEGQMAAFHDFTEEKPKDWQKAYNKLIKNKDIFERFHLSSVDYQTSKDFQDQFKVFFENEYEKSYLIAIDRDATENTNYDYVNTEEKTFSITKPYYKTEKSTVGEMNATSQKVDIVFSEGSVFDNAPVGTPMALRYNEYGDKYKNLPKNLLPQTGIFELKLQRGVNSVEFYKSPKIVFNGYANLPESNSIGVYKWKDSRWKYIPSKVDVEENKIWANIGTGKYKDTEFALFYDKKYKMPNDISLNWAMEAIDVAVRREHVRYEVKIRPDDAITREELADILYRTLSYKIKNPRTVSLPRDVSVGKYSEGIKFCLGSGYFTLFGDGTFKPDMPVRYDHFDVLMKRIYSSNFNSGKIYESMSKLGHYSNYFKGQSPYLTRAEAIYILYKYAD